MNRLPEPVIRVKQPAPDAVLPRQPVKRRRPFWRVPCADSGYAAQSGAVRRPHIDYASTIFGGERVAVAMFYGSESRDKRPLRNKLNRRGQIETEATGAPQKHHHTLNQKASPPVLKKKNWLRIALKRKINLMQTFSASIIHSTLPTRRELKSPYTVMVRPLKMTPISLFLSAQTVLNANWK